MIYYKLHDWKVNIGNCVLTCVIQFHKQRIKIHNHDYVGIRENLDNKGIENEEKNGN